MRVKGSALPMAASLSANHLSEAEPGLSAACQVCRCRHLAVELPQWAGRTRPKYC